MVRKDLCSSETFGYNLMGSGVAIVSDWHLSGRILQRR